VAEELETGMSTTALVVIVVLAVIGAALPRLAEVFAEERARLVGLWDRGDDVSTEEFRLAPKRYRSFFGRLLSV
jgi:hypothetical protein